MSSANTWVNTLPFVDCGREASSIQNQVDAAQVTQESLFLTLTQGDTFAAAFASFLAGVLGVDVSLVEVNDLVLQPGTSITSTSQTSIAIRVDSLITPADSFSAEQVRLFPTSLLCTRCFSSQAPPQPALLSELTPSSPLQTHPQLTRYGSTLNPKSIRNSFSVYAPVCMCWPAMPSTLLLTHATSL